MKIVLLTVLATCVLLAKAYDPPPSYGGVEDDDFEQKDGSVCFLPAVPGPCKNMGSIYWYYDSKAKRCKTFTFHCGGNGNRFTTEKLCQDVCRGPQNIRPFQPPGGGGNLPIRPNNYDDVETKPFPLGGYKPVETLPIKVDDYKPPAVVQPIKVDDYKPAPVQPIKVHGYKPAPVQPIRVDDYKPVDTFPIKVDDYKPERVDPDYKKPGGQPVKTDDYKPGTVELARFPLDDYKPPGAPNVYGGGGDKSHCRLPVAAGDCRAYTRSWHYDPSVGACKSFVYTGCKGNMNRYSSEKSCLDDCKPNDFKVPPPREPVKSPVRPVRPPVRPPIKNDDYNRGGTKY